jgi:hypothetical protein
MLQRTRHGEMKYFLWADDDEVVPSSEHSAPNYIVTRLPDK